MTEQTDTVAVDTPPDTAMTDNSAVTENSISKSIVQSFRQSKERLKAEPNVTEPATAALDTMAMTQLPEVPITSHLGAGMVTPASAVPPKPSRKGPRPSTTRQARRARLRISRVDPWSVMKTALLFGVAAWIIFIVATYVVFTVLESTGLYETINATVATVFASPDSVNTFNIKDYVNTTRATALAALIGAVNVIIFTALATIFAFLYNLSAVVMGGIEVTMAED